MFKRRDDTQGAPEDTASPAQRAQTTMRRVTVNALSDAGWVTGSLHVPLQVRLIDYMNRAPDFLSLTDVFMEAHTQGIPFFALQRHAIVFLIVEGQEEPQSVEDTGIVEEHLISCLLVMGSLVGKVMVKPGVRLSDALAKRKKFMPVTECTYRLRVPRTKDITEEYRPFVLLNCDKIVGLSERSSSA